MSTGGKVCVETASQIKNSHPPSEKRNNYTTAPGETVLATSNANKFHSVMPSCEKWQLTLVRHQEGRHSAEVLAGGRLDLAETASKTWKRFRRVCRKESGRDSFESEGSTAGYCNPQNVASGFTNSNPASQASWLRHTTSASALRPVSCWIRRTRLCSGRSAPTTAMQPE